LLSVCAVYLLWLALLGQPATTGTFPVTSPFSDFTLSDFYYTRQPRHIHLVNKARRRPGGWLRGLRQRLRMRTRAHALAAFSRLSSQRLMCSPIGSPSTIPLQTFNSSSNWSLSSHYPNLPQQNQPRILHVEGNYPIVIDTGASISVTPNAADFVAGMVAGNLPTLRGLTNTTTVAGAGLVEWTVYDIHNRVQTIRTWAFHVPDATICLFSPQAYFQEQGGGDLHCRMQDTTLQMPNGELMVFPYNQETNSPFMLPVTKREHKNTVGLNGDDVDLFSSPDELFDLMSVADETNQNLSKAQKELLKWHWKLGHCNFQWIQALATDSISNDSKGETATQLLQTKHKISVVAPPLCAACQLAKQARRGAGSSEEFKLEDRDMILKRDTTEPGDCVSVNQYTSSVLGRLPHTKGKEKKEEKYNGGTIFVDHATGYIHLTHQVSLRAGETVNAKLNFERFAAQHGVYVKRY
jgi:hypothetical protein